jgi:peptide-methionine (S)-S-oxide reductase
MAKLEKATLAGGCFWCVEAVYKEIKGVKSVMSGYAGGDVENPSYEQVSSAPTGHAEAVQIDFNPELITYEQLLDVFWHVHDPTTLNRQGNDVGPQYRSVIFYHDVSQKEIAENSKANLEEAGEYEGSVVTEIVPYKEFYKAEDYHQDYYENNKNKPYCRIVISPKMKKFRIRYKKLLKD